MLIRALVTAYRIDMSTCCGIAEMSLRMSRRFIEDLIDVLACGKGYALNVPPAFQPIM